MKGIDAIRRGGLGFALRHRFAVYKTYQEVNMMVIRSTVVLLVVDKPWISVEGAQHMKTNCGEVFLGSESQCYIGSYSVDGELDIIQYFTSWWSHRL